MLAGKRILIVEDNSADAMLIRGNLVNEHCEYELAGSLSEAQERVERFQPDIVILDISIPRSPDTPNVLFEDLLDFVRRHKSQHAHIFLTGHVEPDQVDRAMAAGAVDYIDKAKLTDRIEFARFIETAYLLHISLIAKQPEAQLAVTVQAIRANQRAVMGKLAQISFQIGVAKTEEIRIAKEHMRQTTEREVNAKWRKWLFATATALGWAFVIGAKEALLKLIHFKKD